jgi:hypothetical protein
MEPLCVRRDHGLRAIHSCPDSRSHGTRRNDRCSRLGQLFDRSRPRRQHSGVWNGQRPMLCRQPLLGRARVRSKRLPYAAGLRRGYATVLYWFYLSIGARLPDGHMPCGHRLRNALATVLFGRMRSGAPLRCRALRTLRNARPSLLWRWHLRLVAHLPKRSMSALRRQRPTLLRCRMCRRHRVHRRTVPKRRP